MRVGLDIAETGNPASLFQRFLAAGCCVPNRAGVQEYPAKVSRDAVPLPSEVPGEYARYRGQGKAEENSLPFSNHRPIYQVDLNAIPRGSKVGGIIVMDLLAKGETK